MDEVEYVRSRELWRAVVWRAVEDALWIDPTPNAPLAAIKTIESEQRRRDASAAASARRWIEEGGADFRNICDLADLGHGDIQKVVAKHRANGTSWGDLTRRHHEEIEEETTDAETLEADAEVGGAEDRGSRLLN